VAPSASTNGGAVAAIERHAARVGAEALAHGGNAVDAAVATAFALSVTWPPAGNIGGGGFMIVHLPDGQDFAVDFRETSPAALDADLFLDANGRYDPSRATDPGICAGVPGSVAGLHLAHSNWGRLAWADLLEPAIALARHGFEVDESLATAFANHESALRAQPFSAALFLDDQGHALAAGDVLVQHDLADTLERIADQGPAGFYLGPVAEEIARFVQQCGGSMNTADLAAYEPILRKPLRIPHHGYTVLAFGPPTSGGVALGQIAGQLSRVGWRDSALLSADELHLYAEAARRAFAERATYLGDPAFTDVPVDMLLSGTHLDEMAASINRTRATPSSTLGPRLAPEATHDTTHLSVIDRFGTAVSLTTTLEQSFGGKAIAGRSGVLLNNQLRDFNRIPGITQAVGHIGTEPNLGAPGKRPLSSMTPIIVLHDGHTVLVTGSPGGRTIINTVTRVMLAMLDHGLDLEQAVRHPRIHHSWFPDELVAEPGALSDTVAAELKRRGHVVRIRSAKPPATGSQGCAHSVAVDLTTGRRSAVGDPRRQGWAAVTDVH